MQAVGKKLQDRYIIREYLGEGGMAWVWKAFDERLGAVVAIKELKDDIAQMGEELHHAFEKEARFLANIQHEAIPRVQDLFRVRDKPYFVMEFLEGEDFKKKLDKPGSKPFAITQVLAWAAQMLDALHYLHTQETPIIHRDIKPANVQLIGQDKIKLLDFGIATGAAGLMTYIKGGTLVALTPQYAAIEQFLKNSPSDLHYDEFFKTSFPTRVREIEELCLANDPRSDLFSLGATLYHLMTGKPPNCDALKRAQAIWSGKPDPLTPAGQWNEFIPPGVEQVLKKSLEIALKDRYQSAAEMRQELNRAWQAHLNEAEEARRRDEEAQYRQAVQLLETQLVKTQAALTHAQQSQSQETEDYKLRALAAEKGRKAAEYERDQLQWEVKKYCLQAESAEVKVKDAELQRDKAKADYEELTQLGSAHQEQLQNLRQELGQSESRLAELGGEISRLRTEHARLTQENDTQRAEIARYQEYEQVAKTQQQAITVSQAERAQLHTLVGQLTQENKLRSAETSEQVSLAQGLESQVSQMAQRIAIHQKELEKHRSETEKYRQAATENEQKWRQATQKLEQDLQISMRMRQQTQQDLEQTHRKLIEAEEAAKRLQDQNRAGIIPPPVVEDQTPRTPIRTGSTLTLYLFLLLPVFNAFSFGFAINTCSAQPAMPARAGFYVSIGVLAYSILAHYKLIAARQEGFWKISLGLASLISSVLVLSAIILLWSDGICPQP